MASITYKMDIFQIYDFGETLEVKSATHKVTKEKVAIKIIDKSKCRGKEGMIATEVNILKKVKHDNIITLFDMYEIGNNIYLVMGLYDYHFIHSNASVTGGELFDEIVGRGKYDEADASRIIHKILCAIVYLHDLGIAHRDLKPENILLSDRTENAKIMISDFGLSKIFHEDEVMKTACGTPGYVAPEVLKRQGYGKEVDLWSLGVITYILLCGYPPFYNKNNVELFRLIMAGKYTFDRPWWDKISESAKDFIKHLLLLNPTNRSTAREALDHPWIVKYNGVSDLSSSMQALNINAPSTPGPNLAPGIQSNLGRMSSTRNMKDSRPINEKSSLDDSGVVTSNEKMNKREPTASNRASTSTQPSTTVYLHPGPRDFRTLSYNIHLRPPGIKNNHSDHKDARLSLFGEMYLAEYDIIGFQEMFAYGTSRQSKMLQYARKAGYEYYVSSPSKGLLNATVDGGLLLLSKFPIVKTAKMTFKKGVNADKYVAKGVIYAKIAITPILCVHVFNTHLQACSVDADITDPTVLIRLQQVCALKDFMDDCIRGKGYNEPILLMGDFGLDARRSGLEEYNVLMKILKGDTKLMVEIEGDRRARSYPPIKLSCSDTAHTFFKGHPITVGDLRQGKPKETVLTKAEVLGTQSCVDYMFVLNSFGHDTESIMETKETKVEQFSVSSMPFTQLSDHYGIDTTFFAKN